MATQVEGQVLGQSADGVSISLAVALLLQSLERSVSASNVASVVLGVVQLHDLSGDVRLQGIVCVVEFRKFVNSHLFHPFFGVRGPMVGPG